MRRLVLGPLLRHVGERTATVWVETDGPGEVSVLDATSPTFTVHGHHYAIVEIDGLAPGTRTPYEVRLDGEVVWPEPDAGGPAFPPSSIGTLDPGGPLRVIFGSCRRAPAPEETHGVDALGAYARRLTAADGDGWPDVLLLIGDQVYADEPSEPMREFIRARRDVAEPPYEEVCDFEEYAELYRLAWTENPAVRWLLSTVPTLMIFDDHDIRDDWNTSYAWRRQMAAQSWWPRRIVSGLGAYWIYQHLGNLGPAERDADPVYAAVRAAGRDAGKIVDEFAERSDAEPTTVRWSYAQDMGRTRLIVLDSRCGRVLEPDRRDMLGSDDHAWFDERCVGGVDHLLIVSSLPYLLRTPSRTSKRGTRRSPPDGGGDGSPGWENGCGRAPTWSIGRRSRSPSITWRPACWRPYGASAARRRRASPSCQGTCTTRTSPGSAAGPSRRRCAPRSAIRWGGACGRRTGSPACGGCACRSGSSRARPVSGRAR